MDKDCIQSWIYCYDYTDSMIMNFFTEPDSYEKTILSDLQGAWECLRSTVAEQAGFDGWEKMLFHIDEAMSWETVRHLDRMRPLLVLIRNLALQGNAPSQVLEEIDDISEILSEVMNHPDL